MKRFICRSTAGRKVSVGEFFQRKCGNIGHLQETDSISRPSFGVTINSPTKHERVTPLVDETTMTESEGENPSLLICILLSLLFFVEQMNGYR